MADILVIQLARFGDFLQTTPLLQGLKAEDRSNRVSVLIDPANTVVAEKSGCVDEIITVSVNQLSNSVGESGDVFEKYQLLDAACQELSSRYFDLVINLNYFKAAAVLSRVPGAGKVLGYTVNQGGAMIKSSWFVFFNNMVKYRMLSPFNLVDYFYYLYFDRPASKKISFQVSRADEAAAAQLFSGQALGTGQKLIVVHPGTRNEKRSWPISFYSALIDRYLEQDDIEVVLTGSSEDRCLVAKILDSVCSHKRASVHNLSGKASLPVMAAILKRADMLLCADTGILHLAAAMNTRILALFIGPASVYSTGPYCEGAVILQTATSCSACIENMPCDTLRCRNLILPEKVFELSLMVLSNNFITYDAGPEVDLLVSKMDGFGVTYEPVNREPHQKGVLLMNSCYRRMGVQMILERTGQAFNGDLLTGGNGFSDRNSLSDIFYSGIQVQDKAAVAKQWLAEERMKPQNGFWLPWIDAYFEVNDYQSRSSSAYLNALNTGIHYIAHLSST